MTAGFGMISGRPPFATVLEYRGKVFSVGGDSGEHTLPNFFSIYAGASQTGASKGTTLPKSKGKQLNNAISGAKTQDLDDELNRLTRMLLYEKYKHIKDDWKLITLFIGANNVCELCQPPFSRLPELADADVFEANVRAMLERIRTDVGKSFVNLVALFNVSSVYEASREDPYCRMVLDPSHMVICSCIQGNEKQRQAADRIVDEYNRRLQKLEKEFKYKDIHQLGVSYQPSFADFPVSKYKQAYFSGVDW
ncbi:hypothetical protein EDC96DRAFT_543338 [Choanephora cucurbitarum]|nr:hypothetical protein EDC96DRAFT_543338 [Choanephora cucurbitarum]